MPSVEDSAAAAGDDGDGDADGDDDAAAADADAVKSARSHMSSNASDTKGDCDGPCVAEKKSSKEEGVEKHCFPHVVFTMCLDAH